MQKTREMVVFSFVPLLLVSFLLLLLFDCCSPLPLPPPPSSDEVVVSQKHLCIGHEKTALLQFKRLFVITPSAFLEDLPSYSKTESWDDEEEDVVFNVSGRITTRRSDCCLWKGVKCDRSTGHVIELDLSCSPLYGTIPPNSTIFQLHHLRKLDLSGIDFNGSTISPAFGRSFPHLTHLDISFSNFSGLIPSEISHLSGLISLHMGSPTGTLRMEPQAFRMLIENQTRLEVLDIHSVNISSPIPEYIGNISSLTDINLAGNGFYGEIPHRMFHLPRLQDLLLGEEHNGLGGVLPKSNWSSRHSLQLLDLQGINFRSQLLPDSIGCLTSLRRLGLTDTGFLGPIRPWLGNLTEISHLDLSGNSFTRQVPVTLSNLKGLEYLDLSENNFEGEIPDAFGQLNKLTSLYLGLNKFSGKFAQYWWLTNLTLLEELSLGSNYLTGTIPNNISVLQKLGYIDLSRNSLQGRLVQFLPPSMRYFSVSNNNLVGDIPWSICNSSTQQLDTFDLSHNKLVGDIPSSICSSSKLFILNLSHNKLIGGIPECISNSTSYLSLLDLGANALSGTIPLNFITKGNNNLRSVNLNGNRLQGQVPRALANCTELEVLDLGNNNINDTFPYWLQYLPKLQALVLRHNKFHGSPLLDLSNSYNKAQHAAFPKLRILDLSNNEFTGPLPANYFPTLNAMRNVNLTLTTSSLEYMGNDIFYNDTVFMTWKGVAREFQRVVKTLATIDLSSNKFQGEIPNDIGCLQGIQSLNLSSNTLTGHIPSSLANLKLLESLDLSSNQLSGVIPQQLVRVTFLSSLNLSNNRLVGPIPRGPQFETFSNDSYGGNSGLCGWPLTKKCSGDDDEEEPPQQEDQHEDDEDLFDGFGWQVVALGYGCGVALGVVVGSSVFISGKPKWLVAIVEDLLLNITTAMRPQKRRRRQHGHGQRRRG